MKIYTPPPLSLKKPSGQNGVGGGAYINFFPWRKLRDSPRKVAGKILSSRNNAKKFWDFRHPDFVALFCLEKQCSGLFRYFFVVFSWLFRGPRFGQILRVLALEQSSDTRVFFKKWETPKHRMLSAPNHKRKSLQAPGQALDLRWAKSPIANR